MVVYRSRWEWYWMDAYNCDSEYVAKLSFTLTLDDDPRTASISIRSAALLGLKLFSRRMPFAFIYNVHNPRWRGIYRICLLKTMFNSYSTGQWQIEYFGISIQAVISSIQSFNALHYFTISFALNLSGFWRAFYLSNRKKVVIDCHSIQAIEKQSNKDTMKMVELNAYITHGHRFCQC